MNARRHTGILWGLKWFAAVCLLVLVTDLLYVLWPFPNGPRGTAALQANLYAEATFIQQRTDARTWAIVRATWNGLYEVAFVWTGLDSLLRGAADPTPRSLIDEIPRRFVLGHRVFWDTAAIGLQYFALRLGFLIAILPLFLVTVCAAAADGLVTWYRRRTGAGRESGFVYHRAKRGLALSVVGLWLVYLVPPVPLDPRWVVPAWLLMFGITTRITVAYFKKYM